MSEAGNSAISEWVRAILAIFIVIFVMIVLFAIYWIKGIEDFKTIAGVFISLVTAILGYYFGVKGTDDANKRADDANRSRTLTQASLQTGGGLVSRMLQLSKGFKNAGDSEEIRQLLIECEAFVKDINSSGTLIVYPPINPGE